MGFWYSDTYPAIMRAQGVILVPYDIDIVPGMDGEGEQYQYLVSRCRDIGQVITQARLDFVEQNAGHFIDSAPTVAPDEPSATDDWVKTQAASGVVSIVPAACAGAAGNILCRGTRDACLKG